MGTAADKVWACLLNAETHSIGVDYWRITTADVDAKRRLLMIWAKRRQQLEVLGDKLKKGGMQGFQGERVGPLFVGRKDEMLMLQASGSLADELFSEVPWAAVHCTRLDVQCTVKTSHYAPLLAAYLGDARADPFLAKGKEPHPTQNLHVGYGKGDTLYIGSRMSPRFGRVYDKQLESQDERYMGCWRYEVEYKDPVADQVVKYLLQEQNRARAVQEVCKGQFDEWGVEMPSGVPGVLVAGSIGRRVYDSERALNWLRTQVAPTVDRLLGTVDLDTVMESLGLKDGGIAASLPVEHRRGFEEYWEEQGAKAKPASLSENSHR